MSNPIFVFEGVRAATLTASEGSATGFPTTQLQDDRYDTLWESGSNAQNQTLLAHFTIAKNIDNAFIANHNIANLGLTSLKINVSPDGVAWTTKATLTSFPDPLYAPFGTTLYAYAQLVFVKSSSLSTIPQIGLLYIGARADMPLYLNSPERGLQADAIVAESMSGLRYGSSLHPDRETWKINSKSLIAAQLYDWARLVRTVNGMQYPFWFCDMDGNWHFVRFKKDYLPWVGRGNVVFPVSDIEFEEERVGIATSLPGGYTVPAPA
ncbi:MAG: hypothetical protein ABSA44_09580 [Bacteroidota bacterium]|jgi:hypothetical protein